MTESLPTVGITMGDAAGIGPEIVLKALSDATIRSRCRPVIVGDLAFLKKTSESLSLGLELISFSDDNSPDRISVFDLKNHPGSVAAGEESGVTGKASAEYIEAAVKLWHEKKIDAIATAPISKKAISLGGYDFPGHTEFLASLTGTKEFAMSFFADDLRVVLLLSRPVKVAVAGLNPHASEGGMFGNEENDEIVPAVEYCRGELGLDVSGPYSPDTIFLRGHRGEFDGVVACYHDQATIAVKSLSIGSSVNVTLGLPLVRTSVDHGTAFDIAGGGIADASSMKAAISLAADLAGNS
jgi:4-hydroxy-L-threonine phosphate dehydrogenase PdxA